MPGESPLFTRLIRRAALTVTAVTVLVCLVWIFWVVIEQRFYHCGPDVCVGLTEIRILFGLAGLSGLFWILSSDYDENPYVRPVGIAVCGAVAGLAIWTLTEASDPQDTSGTASSYTQAWEDPLDSSGSVLPSDEVTYIGSDEVTDYKRNFVQGERPTYFEFELEEPTRLRIELWNERVGSTDSISGDPYLSVFVHRYSAFSAADLELVARDDDGGPLLTSQIERNFSPGSYTIKSEHYFGTDPVPTGFTLSIFAVDRPPTEQYVLTSTPLGETRVYDGRTRLNQRSYSLLFENDETDGQLCLFITAQSDGEPILSLYDIQRRLIAYQDAYFNPDPQQETFNRTTIVYPLDSTTRELTVEIGLYRYAEYELSAEVRESTDAGC